MEHEHQELEETYGSKDATLRMALAEAEMEISLLKIELMRTRQRLEKAEAALASRRLGLELEPVESAPRHSRVVEKSRRTTAPPSVAPKETVCSPSHFPAVSQEGSAPPKIAGGSSR